jgi:hypothetical protein
MILPPGLKYRTRLSLKGQSKILSCFLPLASALSLQPNIPLDAMAIFSFHKTQWN